MVFNIDIYLNKNIELRTSDNHDYYDKTVKTQPMQSNPILYHIHPIRRVNTPPPSPRPAPFSRKIALIDGAILYSI